ncbi:MAG: histidine kinase dimerization/phospho-acceptor domain-containing protein, partial [Longimicrobiales bacterium]
MGEARPDLSIRLAGVVCAITGALVLLGWSIDAPALIRLAEGLPAMQVTTAAGFLLAGIAFCSRAQRVRRFAGIALLAFGVVTALTFLIDFPLVATILPFPPIEQSGLRPQRPAPATAVGFCFIGAALLLTLRRRVTTTVPAATLAVLAIGVIGLGALDLMSSIAAELALWSPTGRQMALHTAALFVVAGSALALLTRQLSRAGEATPIRRAVGAGTLALVITLAAAHASRISQITAAQRSTRAVVRALVRELEATSRTFDSGTAGRAAAGNAAWLEEAAPGYVVTLEAPGWVALRGGPEEGPADVVFVERSVVRIGGIEAQLTVWPGRRTLDQYRRPVGLAVLVLGSTLAVLLAVAMQSAATASARAARLEEAMRSLARSESRLHESRKMEAVARMAGGIAHEFNNLLSVIRGYAQLLATEDDDASRRSYVAEIEMASTRGSDLTRRLLTVSARHVLNPEALPLRAFLDDRAGALRRMLDGRALLRLELVGDEESLLANIDPLQLEQSLFTL